MDVIFLDNNPKISPITQKLLPNFSPVTRLSFTTDVVAAAAIPETPTRVRRSGWLPMLRGNVDRLISAPDR